MQPETTNTNAKAPNNNGNPMHDHSYSKSSTTHNVNNVIPQRNSETKQDDKNEWQIAASSSKRSISNTGLNTSETSKKSRQSSSIFTVKTSNRFDAISETDVMEESDAAASSQAPEVKPPPIFVPDVLDIKCMVTMIESVIPSSSYTYKCLSQNKIKINTESSEAYRKLVHKLKEIDAKFHTYQLKQDKAYRVVLKTCTFPQTFWT